MPTFSPIQWLFLIPFVLASGVHLAFCYNNRQPARGLSKLLLIPSLLIFVFAINPAAQWVIAALIMSYFGDIFLIYKGKTPSLIAGFAAFGVSHILFLTYFIARIGQVPPWWWVLIAAVLAGIGSLAFVHFVFKDKSGKIKPIVIVYTFLLLIELASGIYGAIVAPHLASWLMIAGVSLFMASDTMLGVTIFIKRMPHAHFYVMSLYLFAEGLLTIALLLR